VEAKESVVDQDDRRYVLCDTCAQRQGREIDRFKLSKESRECFVCGGLCDGVDRLAQKALKKAERYAFESFAVGIILPAEMQEREDQLRSEFKIRGLETIKAQIARKISDTIKRRTRKGMDLLHPDLTFLIDVRDHSVNLNAKSLFIYGKYTKPRGVSQRRTFCEKCYGRGCDNCGNSGFATTPSVEAVIDKRLRKALRSMRTKFTWLGSEDRDSTVFHPGRPLVMEAKNPVKRTIPKRLVLRTGKGNVSVTHLRVLKSRPTSTPAFVFRTRATIHADGPVSPTDVRQLATAMRDIPVQYRNSKGRTVYKKVYSVRAKSRGKAITAEIKMDGGLPVKRLITGESVTPSVSEFLRTTLSCERFDILRVWELGDFGFSGR